MASKTTLNAKNLEALGAARLAELLISLSQGNAAAKRSLRLALAAEAGPADVAREVRKRLATIARSGSFLDWRQRDALLKDLEQQRQAIIGPIASADPALAVDLLWSLLELVEPLVERCADSDGVLMPLFHQATADLGLVAERLTAAGRAAEALAILEAADPEICGRQAGSTAWLDARIAALEALQRQEEAQALRWRQVERSLSIQYLRDYLKCLPAFEDGEAEDRALDLAFTGADFEQALHFLHLWPDQRRAARLILERHEELDGDSYELLSPVAEALERQQPLAATLCLRAMIDFSLDQARFSRYKHAARHLATCRSLAARIDDWAGHGDHASYRLRLGLDHVLKHGFWGSVGEDPLSFPAAGHEPAVAPLRVSATASSQAGGGELNQGQLPF